MSGLKVVALPVMDLRQIPENLRKLADQIERGDCPPVAAVVTLGYDTGTAEVYGYGPDLDGIRTLGWLNLGIDAAQRNCMYRRPLKSEGG